ncbi:hypothetical protein QTP86_005890, partial [Hemibagrus guttatus]
LTPSHLTTQPHTVPPHHSASHRPTSPLSLTPSHLTTQPHTVPPHHSASHRPTSPLSLTPSRLTTQPHTVPPHHSASHRPASPLSLTPSRLTTQPHTVPPHHSASHRPASPLSLTPSRLTTQPHTVPPHHSASHRPASPLSLTPSRLTTQPHTVPPHHSASHRPASSLSLTPSRLITQPHTVPPHHSASHRPASSLSSLTPSRLITVQPHTVPPHHAASHRPASSLSLTPSRLITQPHTVPPHHSASHRPASSLSLTPSRLITQPHTVPPHHSASHHPASPLSLTPSRLITQPHTVPPHHCPASHYTTASARISACLVDISSWMTAHQLKLNPSKTELLVIPGDPSPAQDLAISLNNSMTSPSATARNLGVTMDNQLSFSSHVTNVTRSCRFLLYNIRRIRPFLSTQATQVLVQSLVISRLDYCDSLLAGLPLNAIRPLQMIQNAAAPLVFNLPKFSHTTPLLLLHWLPVAARIRFKTLMLTYKAKNGPAPSYLKALVTPRTAPRSLRSTSTAPLVPPSLREKGDAQSQLGFLCCFYSSFSHGHHWEKALVMDTIGKAHAPGEAGNPTFVLVLLDQTRALSASSEPKACAPDDVEKSSMMDMDSGVDSSIFGILKEVRILLAFTLNNTL